MAWIITLIVLPFVLGFVGQIVKRTILGKKPWDADNFNWFQRAYYRSLAWHAVIVGPLVGLLFWVAHGPIPDAFGDSLLGYMLAGLFSGGVAIIGYQLLVKTIRRMIGAAGSLIGSAPPAVGEDEGSTSRRP